MFNPEFAGGPIGFPADYFVPAQNGRNGDPSVTPFTASHSDLHDPGESMDAAALNVPETNSFLFLLMGLVGLDIHRNSMTKGRAAAIGELENFRPGRCSRKSGMHEADVGVCLREIAPHARQRRVEVLRQQS